VGSDGVGGENGGVAVIDELELRHRVDLRLEVGPRRGARRANRTRSEARAWPVGDEIVGRRADDRDVNALELGRVLGVRKRPERQQPRVVGLLAVPAPALERVDHAPQSYDRSVTRNSEDILTDAPPPAADARLAYGREPKQFGDLRLPDVDRLWPLAVVVHGGSWKAMYNLIHTGHLCVAFARAGIATWNVEYRSVGDVDGVWPGGGDDVAAAVEFSARLAERYPLDEQRVVLVGHSAGGQLALWAAKRAQLPVVALAPVSDMRESARRVGPEGAVARFLGGMPDDASARYAEASPLELLPLGVDQILVHGTADEDVPYEMSERYVDDAGGEATLVKLDDAGHFEPIDPSAAEFERALAAVRSLL